MNLGRSCVMFAAFLLLPLFSLSCLGGKEASTDKEKPKAQSPEPKKVETKSVLTPGKDPTLNLDAQGKPCDDPLKKKEVVIEQPKPNLLQGESTGCKIE